MNKYVTPYTSRKHLKKMALSVFEIFNRDTVLLEHLYEAQDGLQIEITIFQSLCLSIYK